MKISFIGLELPEGKIKYRDSRLDALAQKCSPEKVSPFFAEFLHGDMMKAEAFVVPRAKILDILICDLEKIEARTANASDEIELSALKKAIAILEKETALCDGAWDETELKFLKNLAPCSLKPVVILEEHKGGIADGDYTNFIIKSVLDKAGIVFFYTIGKKELKAWPIEKNSSIVECAAKIHTDFAQGFIKAEVVSFEDFIKAHNMNDARQKNLVKIVGRDYTIKDGDIIEIRFNIS